MGAPSTETGGVVVGGRVVVGTVVGVTVVVGGSAGVVVGGSVEVVGVGDPQAVANPNRTQITLRGIIRRFTITFYRCS